jgi:uncharacterized membrane protein
MGFKEQGKRALVGVRGAFAAALGAAAMMIAVPAMAQQVQSYTFKNLSWGMKSADAQKALAAAGFRVTGQAAGKRTEFAIDRLHAVKASIDRGRRVIAVGSFEGYPVTVELAFGKNDQLNHVFIMSAYWNRTIAGARQIIAQAEKTVASLEKQYGVAKKRIDDRWPDTAYWGNSKDGSTLTVHVRGINGFMFSPSYRTAMRIDFANPKFNGGQIAGVKLDLKASGWTDGPAYMPASSPPPSRRIGPGRWEDENSVGR